MQMRGLRALFTQYVKSTVEKLRNVSTDSPLQRKLATWMNHSKRPIVKYIVINRHKFLTSFNPLMKLSYRHCSLNVYCAEI
jgi:hypothetical protein